jgi:sarcosine dehydrogenase
MCSCWNRGRLTSGSTWHAAGLVGQLRSSASITQVLKYSVDLYKRLAAETGLDTGWKMTGCLRLATTPDRWTEYRRLATTARSFGMEMHLISPDEVKRMWPLMDTSDLIGASWLPTDGQASPSDITQSLAKGARMHGAKLVEGVRVTGFRWTAAGSPRQTTQGTIACEKVVNCAGNGRARSARWPGSTCRCSRSSTSTSSPSRSTGLSPDAPTMRDPDRRTYFKEEVGGLVMGGYEPNPQGWVHGRRARTTGNSGCSTTTGTISPSTWNRPSPACPRWNSRRQADDQRPGKLHARRQLHPRAARRNAPTCIVGAGFNAFGIARRRGGLGAGRMGDAGEAPMDLWVVDIRRFSGLHRDRSGSATARCEAYGKHYTVAFPHEEYESGRPRIVSPLYDRLKAHRAVFGSKLGWERPNWFAPEGMEARDVYSMGRQNWFDAGGRGTRPCARKGGVFDQSSFAKYEVTGAKRPRRWTGSAPTTWRATAGPLTYTQLLNTAAGSRPT